MQVHIFRDHGRVFGCTTEPSGANLPSKYAPWTFFKTVELNKSEPTPGLDVDECLRDLETHGVHVTDGTPALQKKQFGDRISVNTAR